MKAVLLFASLGLAAVASPCAVREFYNRFIAVDRHGVPLEELNRCPSCGRSGSVYKAHQPGDSNHVRCACHGCNHSWLPQPLWPDSALMIPAVAP